MNSTKAGRIVITGAAGLVGQNLIPRLKASGLSDIIGVDKHPANTKILATLHPDIRVIESDLACDEDWKPALEGCDALVVAHAQIGGTDVQAFTANNVTATERLLRQAKAAGVNHVVQISSSVVSSAARDHYTETKKAQEAIALGAGVPATVLRPTLMFGWFDRKHLGWLARFMKRVPVFPIPGHGRYLRQPLFAGDFCAVVTACIERQIAGQTYNISGLERIDYVDLIHSLRAVLGLRTPIIHLPYALFWGLLAAYGLIDRDPPFTTRQLEALATPDLFEVIDWPGLFGVTPTPLEAALRETFRDPRYSHIVLDF